MLVKYTYSGRLINFIVLSIINIEYEIKKPNKQLKVRINKDLNIIIEYIYILFNPRVLRMYKFFLWLVIYKKLFCKILKIQIIRINITNILIGVSYNSSQLKRLSFNS